MDGATEELIFKLNPKESVHQPKRQGKRHSFPQWNQKNKVLVAARDDLPFHVVQINVIF